MKKCTTCGQQIQDNATVCEYCGQPVPKAPDKFDTPAEVDAPNIGFGVLGFFLPILGLILYFVYRETMPLKAKSIGIGALIGTAAILILAPVYGVVLAELLGFNIGSLLML